MADAAPLSKGDQADRGWDTYQERVLRNEGEMKALESLVAETREADRKLIEQRSDSLAVELERRAEALLELVTARADAVLALGSSEREADLREFRDALGYYKESTAALRLEDRRSSELALELLRQAHDIAIRSNYEQSRESIIALESRSQAAVSELAQLVTTRMNDMDTVRGIRVEQYAQAKHEHDALDEERWKHNAEVDAERVRTHMLRYAEDQKHAREEIHTLIESNLNTYKVERHADETARKLQADEYARRLDVLNHAHERQVKFQENAVSRELWLSEKDAQLKREAVVRDTITAIEKAMLSLQPATEAEKGRNAVAERASAELMNAVKVIDTRFTGLDKSLDEVRSALDKAAGSRGGMSAFAGWVIAGVGALATVLTIVIIVANVLTGR